MLNLFKYTFLLLILFAYYSFYILNLNGKSYFFLMIFVSFASIITYIFGIINLLSISFIILIFIGVILFILSLKNYKINYHKILNFEYFGYMIICVVWLYIITRNTGLSHWDDFSHWYRIAKILHFDNSFPITNEILYKTYFPGSACFIYFITKFIPFSVPNCLFAQGLIILGSTSSLLSIFKDNSKLIYKILMTIIGSICICAISTTFYSLIVDALIGLIPLSTFFLIKNSNSKYDFLFLLLLLSFIPLIKVSGILFTIILTLFYTIYKKDKKYKSILLIIIPLVILSLYLVRNSIIFPSINTSNQAISISRFMNIGSSKGFDLILDIIKYYLFNLINVSKYPQIAIVWVSLLILFVICFKNNKKEDFWLSLISFIAYSISLLLVYIFSMDISEANGSYLACFDRYIGTIAIFLFGITFSNIVNHKASLSLIISTMVLFVCLFDFNYLYSHYVYEYTDKMWKELNSKYEEIEKNNTANYLVIYDKNDYPNDISDKAQALCSSFFRSEYVFALTKDDIIINNISYEAKTYIESANEIIWLTDIIDLPRNN